MSRLEPPFGSWECSGEVLIYSLDPVAIATMMRNRSRSMRQELQLSIPSALNEQLFASGRAVQYWNGSTVITD